MKALCIDDEQLTLEQTIYVCKQTGLFSEITGYNRAAEALKKINANSYDVAFLDIDMPDINGIDLALMLKKINPQLMIIFVTAYSQYAVEAFKIHAQGYLCKPIKKEDIINELNYWKRNEPTAIPDGIYIQTFGNFEVFINQTQINFERQKSKEILAYLVNKQGTSVSRAELAAILWEEDEYTLSRQKQLDVYIRSLASTLKAYHIEKIIEKQRGTLRVVPSNFTCDFYSVLKGNVKAINSYCGSYMDAYSWAEPTAGYLDSIRNKE